jgi:hypothetical protein
LGCILTPILWRKNFEFVTYVRVTMAADVGKQCVIFIHVMHHCITIHAFELVFLKVY